MRFIFKRGGRRGGVPNHVAAGSPSGDSRFIDPADALLELPLENPVQLKSLPGGDAERSVAEITRDSIMGEILLRSQRPARQFGTNHEHPSFVEVLLFPRNSLIAIVLLIGSVELKELILFVGKVRLGPTKSFLNRASQGMTFSLNFFDAFGSHS